VESRIADDIDDQREFGEQRNHQVADHCSVSVRPTPVVSRDLLPSEPA
jgi:hypothetical protein